MQANCESSALTVALAYIGTRHLGEEKNCLMVMVLRKSESHPPQKVKTIALRWALRWCAGVLQFFRLIICDGELRPFRDVGAGL